MSNNVDNIAQCEQYTDNTKCAMSDNGPQFPGILGSGHRSKTMHWLKDNVVGNVVGNVVSTSQRQWPQYVLSKLLPHAKFILVSTQLDCKYLLLRFEARNKYGILYSRHEGCKFGYKS